MCDRASYMKMTRGTNLIQQLLLQVGTSCHLQKGNSSVAVPVFPSNVILLYCWAVDDPKA